MSSSLFESAAFYGAPLSVQPVCHHELKEFVDLVLRDGEARLRNLLPLILIKQAEGQQEIPHVFYEWASEDPSFRICWGFTRLALRQTTEQDWSEEDRLLWRDSCEQAGRISIEPQRALENLRRFLNQPA